MGNIDELIVELETLFTQACHQPIHILSLDKLADDIYAMSLFIERPELTPPQKERATRLHSLMQGYYDSMRLILPV